MVLLWRQTNTQHSHNCAVNDLSLSLISYIYLSTIDVLVYMLFVHVRIYGLFLLKGSGSPNTIVNVVNAPEESVIVR